MLCLLYQKMSKWLTKDPGISMRSFSIFMCFYRNGMCEIRFPLRTHSEMFVSPASQEIC